LYHVQRLKSDFKEHIIYITALPQPQIIKNNISYINMFILLFFYDIVFLCLRYYVCGVYMSGIQNNQFNQLSNYSGRYSGVSPSNNYGLSETPLKIKNQPPEKQSEKQSEKQTDFNALPSGKAFKEGTKILLPAKAFDVYHMNALYADTNNVSGDVREINGNLYAKGENPIIEYVPKEQIIQPNSHITGIAKNIEADRRLEELHQNYGNGEVSINTMLPNILMGSFGGAVIGALLGNPLLMMGSLAIGGATTYLANEQYQKSSQIKNDDFKNKLEKLS
jgi:hypothetical protein